MALINNLVLDPKTFPALAEALSQRQPGDRLRLSVEVELVENLPERFSFDVAEAELAGGAATASDDEEEDSGQEEAPKSALAATVLGVMGRRKK